MEGFLYTSFDGVSIVVLEEDEEGKDVEMCREEVVGGVEGMPVDWGVREEEEEGEDIVDRAQDSCAADVRCMRYRPGAGKGTYDYDCFDVGSFLSRF